MKHYLKDIKILAMMKLICGFDNCRGIRINETNKALPSKGKRGTRIIEISGHIKLYIKST
jgi:hypothetical protein